MDWMCYVNPSTLEKEFVVEDPGGDLGRRFNGFKKNAAFGMDDQTKHL